MKTKTLTQKAVEWFDGLSIEQKDRLQYEISASSNYTRWGNKLKLELYKRYSEFLTNQK